jgi:hypothetical protein
MTKPELDWSLATDLRLGRPDGQHLTHRGKFGFEAVSFRAEAVDFVFDFGPSSTSRYDDMDITPLLA